MPDAQWNARAAATLGQIAWAYLDRVGAGDRTRASETLKLFQEHYNRWRSSLVATTAPRSLTVDGVYGPQSRFALMFTLIQALGSGIQPTVSTIPLRVADVGGWFVSRVSTSLPETHAAWTIAHRVEGMTASRIRAELGTAARAYVEGGGPAQTDQPVAPGGGAETPPVADGTGETGYGTGTGKESVTEGSTPVSPRPVRRPSLVAPASTGLLASIPNWGWAAMAGVVGIGAVWLVFYLKKRKGRK